VSLAHQGVLFLDELPLFRREALDGLRDPLDRGQVTLHGAGRSRRFPARFVLIAAMNACPCGELPCRCSPQEVARYLGPLSGALLDRLDLVIEVPPVSLKECRSARAGECSATVASRIARARELQQARCGRLNGHLGTAAVRYHCPLDSQERLLMDRGFERLGLSVREATSILKLTRTIADLAGSDLIRAADLAQAVQYKFEARDLLHPRRPVEALQVFRCDQLEAREP
jgi:magnesium chelatase family protein